MCLVPLKWLFPFEEIPRKGQCRREISLLHLSHVLSGLGSACFFVFASESVSILVFAHQLFCYFFTCHLPFLLILSDDNVMWPPLPPEPLLTWLRRNIQNKNRRAPKNKNRKKDSDTSSAGWRRCPKPWRRVCFISLSVIFRLSSCCWPRVNVRQPWTNAP